MNNDNATDVNFTATRERIIIMDLLPGYTWLMEPEPEGEPEQDDDAEPPHIIFPPVDSRQPHTLSPSPADPG